MENDRPDILQGDEAISQGLNYQWRDTSHVRTMTILRFSGFEIVLLPNGTYFLDDTSGG